MTDIAVLRMAQFAGTLLWRPVSGYLTDATAHVADWVLLAGVVAELVTLLALALLPVVAGNGNYSVWLVLGVQLVKAMIEIQIYNSVWKIVSAPSSPAHLECGLVGSRDLMMWLRCGSSR